MKNRIIEELRPIHSITMLNESCAVFCSKLDLYSKAIVYDFNEKKIVAEYKSKRDCQLVFYRTNKEDLFVYYNQGKKGREVSEEKPEISSEKDEKSAKNIPVLNSSMDFNAIDKILDEIVKSAEAVIAPIEINDFHHFFNVPKGSIFLINSKTFIQETKKVSWIGDDAIFIGKEKIYIDRPWKSSVEEKDFARATSIQYNFNASIKQSGTSNFFHLSYDMFDEMNSTWSSLPLFNITLRIKNHDFDPFEDRKKFRGLLISGCSIGDEHLIFGCHTSLGDMNHFMKRKPFKIGIWDDDQSSETFKKSVQLDHVISKLSYIPEKKLIIGLVSGSSSFFYIFNKNLTHKIINTGKLIADIAIFDHGSNKIVFMDGTMNDLEIFINPEYYAKYNQKTKEALDQIPSAILPIIIDYSYSKNCFSLLNPKPTIIDNVMTTLGFRK